MKKYVDLNSGMVGTLVSINEAGNEVTLRFENGQTTTTNKYKEFILS